MEHNSTEPAERTINIRSGTAADIQTCSEVCYRAFRTIAEYHHFPSDMPSPDSTTELMSMLFSRPDIYAIVAEVDGQIAGSNFLSEEAIVAGVGPLSVDPSLQNATVGRRLMEAVLERAQQRQFASVRLVQNAFNSRSLSLYTKLGFDVQEPLASLQGQTLELEIPGYTVRSATEADLEACNQLCLQIHGFDRAQELHRAIQQSTATVVEHNDRITGYATSIGFYGHAVGESNEDLKALIGAAKSLEAPGFLLPTRNHPLIRWCLQQGLRVVQPMTLMSLGLYNQPNGVFLPSIVF